MDTMDGDTGAVALLTWVGRAGTRSVQGIVLSGPYDSERDFAVQPQHQLVFGIVNHATGSNY